MLICWNVISVTWQNVCVFSSKHLSLFHLSPPILPCFFFYYLFIYFAVFDLTLPTGSFLLMYPKWRTAFATISVEPWCGNRLAVCVLHIACSQRLRGSEQNNNRKFGLSAECQDCLVVGSLQHTRGTFAVIHWAEMLEFQRQDTLLGIKRGKSVPQFACWGFDGNASLQVLGSSWRWVGPAESSWKRSDLYIGCYMFQNHFTAFTKYPAGHLSTEKTKQNII